MLSLKIGAFLIKGDERLEMRVGGHQTRGLSSTRDKDDDKSLSLSLSSKERFEKTRDAFPLSSSSFFFAAAIANRENYIFDGRFPLSKRRDSRLRSTLPSFFVVKTRLYLIP